MFAADVRDSLPCRKNHVGPIPDRLYAKGTSGEPEIVLKSRKKVDDSDHFRSHDRKNNQRTTYQKSFDVVDNLERKTGLLSEPKKKFKDRVLTKSKEINDSVDKAVRSYTREGTTWRFIDLERSAATFDTVAMESEAKKGIIDDLDKFVVSKEAAGDRRVRRRGWKRGYFLNDVPGGTGSESSLISAMANYLSFDIYELNLPSSSFIEETVSLLDSIANRSIIVIKTLDCNPDTQDRWPWGSYQFLLLTTFWILIDGLSFRSGNDRIIVFTTHEDRLDPFLMDVYVENFFVENFYIDKFSPSSRPRGLTGGGENLQLDSTDQQSLVDFDAINNRAHLVRADQSVPIVCYSEKISTGETLKREFIDNSVLSLEDTQQYSGGRPDGAPKSLGATKRGYFVEAESKEIKDNFDKAVESYTREGIDWCSTDMERPVATFDTLAMESEVKKGVIDDLDKFVVSKEKAAGHSGVRDKAWKRGYLLYDPPGGTGSESSLIAAMANYLSYDIFDFKLAGLSSRELEESLVSIPNCSIIAIKDFDCSVDMQDGPLNLNKTGISELLTFIDSSLSSNGNDRIIVFTSNQDDQLDPALLVPFMEDFYIHKSSPSPPPGGLTEGGENLQLDSTDQQSLVDFDAINNRARLVRADQSVPIACYSEKISTGEALKREFIDNSALSLEDTQQYSGGRPDDAPKSLGATKRGYFVEAKSKEIKDNVDKALKCYTREGIDWCSIDMERPVAMESAVKKGIIDDLDKFVVSKEAAVGHKRVIGKAWKRCYWLYAPPESGSELSLAAMANYLSYDIFVFDLMGLSSRELEESLVSTSNCSIIAIKYFDYRADMQYGPLNPNKMGISELLTFIDSALSSNGNDRIVVFTSNQDDQLDPALLVPFMEDFYIHKSSPSPPPRGLTEGGENLQLDSTDQQSLVDFDAINNRARLVRADQSVPIACYSEKISTGEALKREFIDNSALSLEDTQQYSGGRPDDAPKSLGDTFGQQLHPPDSLGRKSFKVLETLPLQKQEQPNDIIPLKREFINKGVLSLEDPQQRLGSGCEDDATTLVVRTSNMKGILWQHEIHQWPFQQNWATMKVRPKGVLSLSLSMDEKLDPRLQSAYVYKLASSSSRPLALPYGGEIVGPISLSSSEVAAMNIKTQPVSQDQSASAASHFEKKTTRVTSKREGITSRVFSSEDGQQHFGSRHKDSVKRLGASLRQSLVDFDVTNNRARLVKADQSRSTVSNSEKENTREALKREHVNESVLNLEDPQHFGGRSKDASKGLGFPTTDSLVPKSFKLRETLRLQEQPNYVRDLVLWRRLKIGGCVRLEKLPDLPQIQQMNCSGGLTPQSASFSQWTVSLPRGEPIVELDPLEKSAENAAYGAREDQSYTVYLSEKKIERKTLKRKFRIMCVLSLQDGHQHTCGKCEDAANSLGGKRICREHEINQVFTVKRIGRQNGIHRCLFEQSARTSHWPIGLPDGGPILQLELLEPSTNNVAHGARAYQIFPTVSLSNKKILSKTLNREFRPMTLPSLENHQQHFGSRCEDSGKSLGVKRICRKHGINQASKVKRIRRQHGVCCHRWPFRRKWTSMKGYSLGEERPVEVIGLSMHERFVSRLQCIYRSRLPRSSHWPLAIRNGGKIVGHIALSSSEFAGTNNSPHFVRQDKSGSNAPHPEKRKTRETTNKGGTASSSVSKEDLEQLFGMTRKDAAERLGFSESTFKRVCREHGIPRWPSPIRKNVRRPPDPHGERNISSTCATLAINGPTQTENGIGGQNLEANDLPPDSFEAPNLLNAENGPTAGFVNQPTFHYDGPVYSADMDLFICQPSDPSTPSTVYSNPSAPVVQLPQIASTQPLSENMGSSEGFRSVIASQEQHFWPEHVSGYNSTTLPTCSGPVLDQQMPSAPYVMPTNPQMPPLMERQDMRYVTVKATYDDVAKIKFKLSLASGITELKKQVERRLGVDSFDVEYEDEERDWIRIACDEDLSDYLHSSLANPIVRLRVLQKVSNDVDYCKSCSRSLKRKRPQ